MKGVHTRIVKVSQLRVKAYTRLHCHFGCRHFGKAPVCPPAAPGVEWFKDVISRYGQACVLWRVVSCRDEAAVMRQQREFHRMVLEKERALKEKGHHFALGFVSGVCSMCSGEVCKEAACLRRLTGRAPLCATGIDVQDLAARLLGLGCTKALSFWRANLTQEYRSGGQAYLCLGVVLY